MTSGEYKEKTDKLFQEWENKPLHQGEAFVRDGVINPEEFFSQKIRPLFLLKEAYAKDGKGWDLAEEHRYEIGRDKWQRHTTWTNISRWTYGLFNTTKDSRPEYEEQVEFHKKQNPYLQKIAALNIKKSGGKSYSQANDLKKYACNDSNEIVEQIHLIDPNVIVCGSTLWLLELVLKQVDPSFKIERNDNWFYFIDLPNGHKTLVIDFYHPSCRRSKVDLFNKFVEVYQKAISKCDWMN